MKIGLCLAGGGASGGAHVGVIRALEEAGLSFAAISGTSSGAMVAGLFASGMTTKQMINLLPTLTRRHIDIDFALLLHLIRRDRHGGFIKGERLHSFLREALGDMQIDAVKIPLAIVATDLQTGGEVVFSSHNCPSPHWQQLGDVSRSLWSEVQHVQLATAIRASISIPFIFQPLRIDHMVLADGGLVDNCPVEPLRALGADFIIAVDTITPFLRFKSAIPLRMRVILQQIVNVGLSRHAQLAARQSDIFLTPSVGPIGALDFPRLATVAERGYEYTKARMPAIIAAIRAKDNQ